MSSPLHIVIGTKNYSSWSLRGWLAVAHTGLAFSEQKLPLDTSEFHDQIGDLSPTRCVPVLHHEGQKVWDSLAVIDYCARLVPEKNWWPEQLSAYGHARSVAAEMHSGFTALRNHAPMNIRGRWTGLSLSHSVAADINRIEEVWNECRNKYSENGAYLFGDFGAVDMMYAPVVSRLVTYDISVSNTSREYMNNILNHPLIQRWCEEAKREEDTVFQDELPQDITMLG
ncbi:glutathione S-transferase family protein [Kordiimonas sp. SCSIO 12610]|uniref:glutathione S-transferase family protein n=1 Tax=Kordiimonas sp. SCSIO 12610 TaxID=2829597 RepID=UPI002108F96C|nr:glutathione S-transferase family protein [Kordiimonas sp. SCSIO 12610]UTW55143.1 glutathione S-transferase family protein [Kordiimonas sp. SCSIO 12610]